VLFQPSRVTVQWSEGNASFEPYYLEVDEVGRLDALAKTARGRLAAAIHGNEGEAAYRDLTGLGHQLYRLLFRLDGPENAAARAVQEWWRGRSASLASLDVLSNAPGRVPFNLVHEGDATEDGAGLWGFRHALGVGRRVSPLLSVPSLVSPTALLLLEERQESTRELLAWTRERQMAVATSLPALMDTFGDGSVDVLYLSGRAEAGSIHWNGQSVRLDEVYEKAASAEEGSFPLVVLDVHGELAQVEHWECFVAAAARDNAGAVLPEVPLPADQAGKVSRSVLQALLGGRIELGSALRQARRDAGLAGLAWSAFAPAGWSVDTAGDDPYVQPELASLPEEPYSPFEALDRGRRMFLAGRQADVLRFVAALDEPGTRGVMLHGGASTGTTSFLHAGVLPYLEDETIGFQVIRDRSGEAAEHAVLTLRAGPDLLGQVCQALAYFAATTLEYDNPASSSVRLDLPGLLTRLTTAPESSMAVRAGGPMVEKVSAAPLSTPHSGNTAAASPEEMARGLYRLGMENPDGWLAAVDELTRRLPFDLVLVFEHAEDVVAAGNETDRERSRRGLDLVTRLIASSNRCKAILSLRTESLGEFLALMPAGKDRSAWREFFLPPLSAEALEELFQLPSASEPLPYGDGAPHAKYQFFIEPGLPATMVGELQRLKREGQFAPLPLLHIIASEMFRRAKERGDNTLRRSHLKALEPLQEVPAKLVERGLKGQAVYNKETLDLLDRLAQGSGGSELLTLRTLALSFPGSGAALEQRLDLLTQTDPPVIDAQTYLVKGQPEVYVGLAGNAIAQTRSRQREVKTMRAYGWTKVVDTLWIMIPLAALAAAVAFFFTRRFDNLNSQEAIGEAIKLQMEKDEAEIKELQNRFLIQYEQMRDTANWGMYQANMARAEKAITLGDLITARGSLISAMPMPTNEKGDSLRREIRGFEWFYLWRRMHPERYVLQGHIAPVSSVVVSPDGKWIASASLDGVVKLWDRATLREIDAIPGSKQPVRGLAFTAEGKALAVARADKKVLVYDIKEGKDEVRFSEKPAERSKGYEAEVVALAAAKGQPLTSADAKGNLVFGADGDKETVVATGSPIHAIAYGPGDVLLSGGKGGKVTGLTAGKGKEAVFSADTPLATVDAIAWSESLGLYAVGGSKVKNDSTQGAVVILDKAGKVVGTPLELNSPVRCLAWIKDKNTVAIGTRKHALQVWDRDKGDTARALPSHLGWINTLVGGADGLVISGGQDAQVKVWSLSPDFEPDVLPLHDGALRQLAFSPDGKVIVSGDSSGVVRFTDPSTGRLLAKLEKPGHQVNALAFSSDKASPKIAIAWSSAKGGGQVLIAQLHGDAKGFELKNQIPLPGVPAEPRSLVFSRDGKSLYLAAGEGKAQRWDAEKGVLAKEFDRVLDDLTVVALTAEDQVLLAGTGSGAVVLFDTETGKKRTSGKGEGGAVRSIVEQSLAGTTDEARFFTWGDDQMLRLWEWKDGQVKARFAQVRAGTTKGANVVKGMKSSALIFSLGDAGVQINDLTLGIELRERYSLTGQSSPVRVVAIAPDEQTIAAGSEDGSVRLWRAAMPEQLRTPR